jgi:hypothetical protein
MTTIKAREGHNEVVTEEVLARAILRGIKSSTSRNQREGHFFGKVNGRPRRVPFKMRSVHIARGHHKRRWNFQFGPVPRSRV